ncbi:hypothetical protein D3C71_2048060 [compost metagenome]
MHPAHPHGLTCLGGSQQRVDHFQADEACAQAVAFKQQPDAIVILAFGAFGEYAGILSERNTLWRGFTIRW